MPRRRAVTAAVLSLVPGAGHLYLGQKKKGLVLLCVDMGIILILFSTQIFLRLGGLVAYVVTMLPAVVECYRLAEHDRFEAVSEARWYVITMLLITGFSALPLLWQNARFSKNAKIAWTIAVPLLAAAYFAALFLFIKAKSV